MGGLGYRLARGQEVNLSLRVALFLYLGAKVGGICSLLSLLYFFVLLAFTVPKLYTLNKDKVSSMVVAKGKELGALAQEQFKEKVLSKIKIPAQEPASAPSAKKTE